MLSSSKRTRVESLISIASRHQYPNREQRAAKERDNGFSKDEVNKDAVKYSNELADTTVFQQF